jgi:hypothetical protein
MSTSEFPYVPKDVKYSNLLITGNAVCNKCQVNQLIYEGSQLPTHIQLQRFTVEANAIQDEINSLINEIQSLTTSVQQAQTQSQTNANNNATNVADTLVNTNQIATNTTNINTNTMDIAANTANIAFISTAIPFVTGVSTSVIPSATNTYVTLGNNSFTLTEGTWMLYGCTVFSNNNNTVSYIFYEAHWTAANGANNATVPSALENVSNLTINAVVKGNSRTTVDNANVYSSQSWLGNSQSNLSSCMAPIVRVTIAAGTTSGAIYLVPYFEGTFNNARIWARYYAQRIY